eukprot:scaffold3001_cov215-Prasinococcus_capsulatus_cf.AAC.2
MQEGASDEHSVTSSSRTIAARQWRPRCVRTRDGGGVAGGLLVVKRDHAHGGVLHGVDERGDGHADEAEAVLEPQPLQLRRDGVHHLHRRRRPRRRGS